MHMIYLSILHGKINTTKVQTLMLTLSYHILYQLDYKHTHAVKSIDTDQKRYAFIRKVTAVRRIKATSKNK